MSESIEFVFRELVANNTGMDFNDSTEIDGSGVDSLDCVEIAIEIEDGFDCEIDIKKIGDHKTFGEMLKFIKSEYEKSK